jgi:hypothetical protein
MKRQLIIFIAIVFMIQSAMASVSNFIPTQAVSIQSTNGNPTNKIDPLLVANLDQSGITLVSKALLKFDLTNLPKNVTIDNATLVLFDSKAAHSSGVDVLVKLFDNNNWNQSTNSFPTGNSILLSHKDVTNTGTYSWDVKQGISNNVITLLLEANASSKDIVGFSGLGTPGQPVLTVNYTEIKPSSPLMISVPGNITIVSTGVNTTVDIGMATTTGGVPPINITNDAPVGNNFSVGQTIVTWTAIDDVGTTAKGEQLITVTTVPQQDTILAYYRGLGKNPNIVETRDLLKAADDYREKIVPSGFSLSITLSQLMTLADEWKNS